MAISSLVLQEQHAIYDALSEKVRNFLSSLNTHTAEALIRLWEEYQQLLAQNDIPAGVFAFGFSVVNEVMGRAKEAAELFQRVKVKRDEKVSEICERENNFLAKPTEPGARDLLARWKNLLWFKKGNGLPSGMNRMEPLLDFLKAKNEKEKEAALKRLERLRHDD